MIMFEEDLTSLIRNLRLKNRKLSLSLKEQKLVINNIYDDFGCSIMD